MGGCHRCAGDCGRQGRAAYPHEAARHHDLPGRLALLGAMAAVALPGAVACDGTTAAPSGTGSPRPTSAASSTLASGLYQVNGHHLYLTCAGTGQPTVMLEAGLSADHNAWEPVNELAPLVGARVCAYDRYGLGQSDIPASTPTRTIDQVVDDLHALIEVARIPGPLVLAGHSMGGLIVREFARRYPSQVVGMLLFDSAPDDWDVYTGTETFTEGGESIDVQAAAAELRLSDSLGSMPLIVVQAGDDSEVQSGWAPGKSDFQSYWSSRQLALAKASTNSIFVIAPGVTHDLLPQQPPLLSPTAMKLVVDAVHGGTPLPACGQTQLPNTGATCLSKSP